MNQANSRWTMPEIRLPMFDGEGAVLMRDWDVCVNGLWFHVPAGFRTDGASIPRFLWRLCGHPLQFPRVVVALLHDFIYSGGGRDVCPTRAEADVVYRDFLVEIGWGKVKAGTEYCAIRIFGGSHWTAIEQETNQQETK